MMGSLMERVYGMVIQKATRQGYRVVKGVVLAIMTLSLSGQAMATTSTQKSLAEKGFAVALKGQARHLPARDQDIDVGFLDMVWHDDFSGTEQVTIELVNEQGRQPLNRKDIELASEDLYALAGQEVAVYTNPRTGKVEAMVGISDLSPLIQQGGGGERAKDAVLQRRRIVDFPTRTPNEQHRWKTIACKFQNTPFEPVSRSFLATQYGPVKGHIGHFWKEMSYGKISVTGSAHGWFELPRARSYYFVNGRYDSAKVSEDCINVARDHVDFSNTYGINIALNMDGGPAQGGRKCGIEGMPQYCMPMTWLPLLVTRVCG